MRSTAIGLAAFLLLALVSTDALARGGGGGGAVTVAVTGAAVAVIGPAVARIWLWPM